MRYPIVYEEISTNCIQAAQRPLARPEEFERAVAAAKRRKRKFGLVAVKKQQGDFHLIGNDFVYRLAQSEGIEKVPCIVFEEDEDVPSELAELLDIYNYKLTPAVDKADLIASIVDSGFLNRSELAKVLGAPKSTITQLYSLSMLPADVKKDSLVDPTVKQTELFQIAACPSSQQSNEYWARKKLVLDRQQNPIPKAHHEVHEACELMLRTAGTITRVLARNGDCFNTLNAQQRAELHTAEKSLSDALSNLQSFTETNSLKKFVRSFFR